MYIIYNIYLFLYLYKNKTRKEKMRDPSACNIDNNKQSCVGLDRADLDL